ncbi:MAG: hypothetical protein K2H72_10040, partial [Muribaculaceae bacterium]|nr:hypothetical protein [Muribaculaceae bacterium]
MKSLLSIIAILTVLLSGCSGENQYALNLANAVIEEHPDSALHILQRIDRTNLSVRELPYYALLMTQAMVKNDIPVTSDSLISIAYGKYGDDWRGDRGIRSNFYMGETLFNREKYREAMKFYLAAYEESKRLGNDYWHAKAAERIADLFFYSYNYDEAEKYMMEAAELFGITGRDLNQKYAIASLGILYINNYKENLAENLLDSLYRECLIKYPQDSDLSAFVRRPLIEIYVKQSRIEELTESDYRLLLNSSSYQEEIDNTILLNTYSNLQESFGNRLHDIGLDLQHADMIAFTHEDKALLYYARYRYEKENGNYQNALNLIDSLLIYQCSLTEDILKESVSGSRSSFYSIKADIEHKRYIYLSIILVLTLFVLVLTFILFKIQNRNKTLKHRHELESVLDSMAELNEYASNISSDCMELQATIKEREDRVSNLQNEIEHLERQNSEVSSDMMELKGVIIKREETLGELKNKIDSLLKKQALTDKTIENLFK